MSDIIYVGDYAIRPFAILDDAGAAFDLTGCNVQYRVEREGEPTVDVWDYDSDTNPTIVIIDADPTTGLVEVLLYDGGYLSEGLADQAVYFEQIRVFDADGNPQVAIRQQFTAARAL